MHWAKPMPPPPFPYAHSGGDGPKDAGTTWTSGQCIRSQPSLRQALLSLAFVGYAVQILHRLASCGDHRLGRHRYVKSPITMDSPVI